MKIKQGITYYVIIVLAFATASVGANNYIAKKNVPASTVDKTISQKALSDTPAVITTDTPTAAPVATTVKPVTKTSTVSAPKTTVKAASTATVAATETPTEPVTPPQLTEEEKVYKFAHIDSSKIITNSSKYNVTIDKTSLPSNGGSIYIQVNPLERWAAAITTTQCFQDNNTLMSNSPLGGWIMSPDGKTYSNTYKGDIGVAFNGALQMNLYVFITEKNDTIYQYKFKIVKS